ncbi:hypothetical protein QBC41DRAFT_61212 [Cercophora samala]|uniref:Uncharacterized protein n=1 Tax=Cercophora samala TaxID=330535 RepID=A0AA39ZHD1_9PEZI|nr:hypothetical protein QBC41DRAFT_61212 [Cercophora samala]
MTAHLPLTRASHPDCLSVGIRGLIGTYYGRGAHHAISPSAWSSRNKTNWEVHQTGIRSGRDPDDGGRVGKVDGGLDGTAVAGIARGTCVLVPEKRTGPKRWGTQGTYSLPKFQCSGTGRLLAVSLPSGIHPVGKLLPTRHLCANQTDGSGLDLDTDLAMGTRHWRWDERAAHRPTADCAVLSQCSRLWADVLRLMFEGDSKMARWLQRLVEVTAVVLPVIRRRRCRTKQDQAGPMATNGVWRHISAYLPQPAKETPCDAQESRSIEMTALVSPMGELEIGCNRGSGAGCCLSVSFSDIRQKAICKAPAQCSVSSNFLTNSQSISCRLKRRLR